MKKRFGDYYLGLDIGTNSVGMAVTDLDYKILKINGKPMWSVRLFHSGETAEKCRTFRTSRRRLDRKKQRIKLLQYLFAEEIAKVDMGFYQRMQESKFYDGDKNIEGIYCLFNDLDYKDDDYHKEFPTIYHLRKSLIENNREFDVRLVYLALHHIIKHRGHFLFPEQNIESIKDFDSTFNSLKTYLKEEAEIEFECTDIIKFKEKLSDKKIGKNEKYKILTRLLTHNDKPQKAITGLLTGKSVKLNDIFGDSLCSSESVLKVTFDTDKYEEMYEEIESIIGEKIVCLDNIKTLYDWALLNEIMGEEEYLSCAKVKIYEKHKRDLEALKKCIKRYFNKEEYKKIFNDENTENNYCAYVGINKINHRKQVIKKGCTQIEMCKFLKKELDKIKDIASDDENYKYIYSEAENNTLLPKQVSNNNGVIPYQIHLIELNKILKNSKKYLPFLNEEDEYGTIAEKIESIFKFKIPYYVGPLNDAHKEDKKSNCWIIKKSGEKIYPWNFNDVVDIKACAEEFIYRMTNKCTYLRYEDVLPKNSLLYSEFMILNELNNLRIDGEKLDIELKKRIFEDLYKNNQSVTVSKIKRYLISEGITDKEVDISGTNEELKAGYKSYVVIKKILGNRNIDNVILENIIKWLVLFSGDRKILKSQIKENYGEIIDDKTINRLCTISLNGWGRLSKKFLSEIKFLNKENNKEFTVIGALRNTNDNLMQLLSEKYSLQEEIIKCNNEEAGKINKLDYNIVEELYVSPAVKRSIWQALQMVDEIHKIMGKQPKKIFIEMTRGSKGNKKATKSRKQILLDLYKNCEKDQIDWCDDINLKDDSDFRRDRLFLYYTQMGKCVYCGKNIVIDDIYDNKLYDVDHIYPRCRVKDDSINNRVLVCRKENEDKGDKYPIAKEIQDKNKTLWNLLLNKGLISKEKYERLVRREEFTDSELTGFIARQIVETGQSTKAVAEILDRYFDNTEVVYVKSENVNEFRHKFDIIKLREINDYHHAKDAYLNIVVGNTYNTKFTHSPLWFIQKENKGRSYNLDKLYDNDVIRNGITAWKTGDNGTIAQVKKVIAKNNIQFTRYSYCEKGELFNQNILGKGKGQLPIKPSDKRYSIEKYGGYNSIRGTYFMLVEHKNKRGNTVRTLEDIPIYLAGELNKNTDMLIEYCINNLKLTEPKIIMSKIKRNALFKVNGFKMHLTGRSNDNITVSNANQLCIDEESIRYIKKIIKYLNRVKLAKKDLPVNKYDELDTENNIRVYDMLRDKISDTIYNVMLNNQVKNLDNGKETFNKLEIGKQCEVLGQILKFFNCDRQLTDLSLICGGKNKTVGNLSISKDITKYIEVKIINQSITGLFEEEVDLLKL